MRIYENLLATIGKTPLVRVRRLAPTKGTVLAKMESFNPGGSIKDRVALNMVERAEEAGLLRPGGTIIECTSGNTGLGLAIAASVKRYKAIFTMPDKVAEEKSRLLRAFGAEVILCPTAVEPQDPRSYYSVARRLNEEIENSFYPNQYENPHNPEIHYGTTGPEIWEDTDGRVTHFLAGMGTGGTISGIGKYLKEQNPEVQVIGVDPVGSLYHEYFTTGKLGEAHTYKVEGIGEDMIPGNMDFSVVDEVIQVTDRDSYAMARRMTREEAIFSGSSAGSALWGAAQVAARLGPEETLVVLIPDTGERYLSKVYNEDWLKRNQLVDERNLYTAGEIIARKKKPLEELLTIRAESSLREAIQLMQDKLVSQLPVVKEGRMVGSVHESGVIEALLHGERAADRTVEDVMGEPFPEVAESADAEEIYHLLSHGHSAVLVPGADGDPRIITKWDLLHSMGGIGGKR